MSFIDEFITKIPEKDEDYPEDLDEAERLKAKEEAAAIRNSQREACLNGLSALRELGFDSLLEKIENKVGGDLLELYATLTDEDWETLTSVGEKMWHEGKRDNGADVFSLLQLFRPWEPKPYFYRFSLVWERNGVEEAAKCYLGVCASLSHPVLFYHATNCFKSAGFLKEAKIAIKGAREMLDLDLPLEIDEEMKKSILELYEKINVDDLPIDIALLS